MASCFDRGAIAWHLGTMGDRDYFSNAITHFRGYCQHGCSDANLTDNQLRKIDPVASSFREMTVETEFPRLDDIDIDHYEKLFEDACRGSLEDVKISLQVLKAKSLPVPLQPLATVAADRGFPDILNFCLSQGAVFDPDLDMAALYTTKTPEMLDVLMAQNWRNIALSESARRETGCAPGSKNPHRPPIPELPKGYATSLTHSRLKTSSATLTGRTQLLAFEGLTAYFVAGLIVRRVAVAYLQWADAKDLGDGSSSSLDLS